MKTMLALILITLHLVFAVRAQADIFPVCPPMSKDPKCWETPHDPRPPLPRFPRCGPLASCSRIVTAKSVQTPQGWQVMCLNTEKQTFVCTHLAKTHGLRILGMPIEMTWEAVDTCHVLGGCGGRACGRGQLLAVQFAPSVCR